MIHFNHSSFISCMCLDQKSNLHPWHIRTMFWETGFLPGQGCRYVLLKGVLLIIEYWHLCGQINLYCETGKLFLCFDKSLFLNLKKINICRIAWLISMINAINVHGLLCSYITCSKIIDLWYNQCNLYCAI